MSSVRDKLGFNDHKIFIVVLVVSLILLFSMTKMKGQDFFLMQWSVNILQKAAPSMFVEMYKNKQELRNAGGSIFTDSNPSESELDELQKILNKDQILKNKYDAYMRSIEDIAFYAFLIQGVLLVTFVIVVTTVTSRLFRGNYVVCGKCDKSVLIVCDWRCDYCNKKQGKQRLITKSCVHCKRSLKSVYCEHCHEELSL